MPFPIYTHSLVSAFIGDESPLSESGRWIQMPTWPGVAARKVTGQLAQSAGGDDYWTAIYQTTTYGDFEMIIDVPTLDMSINALDFQFRLAGSPPSYTTRNGYVFYTTTDGNSVIYRLTGNVEAQLVDFDGSGTGTWTSGDKLGIQAIGTSISAWRYRSSTWTEILSGTDSAYSSGYFAPGGFGGSSRYDNLTVGVEAEEPPPGGGDDPVKAYITTSRGVAW